MQRQERGVLYFSAVPMDMRPNEIRLFFQKYGEIFRQRFVKRQNTGPGTKRPLQFKEGWLEFMHAKDARKAAEAVNGHPIDCKRRRRCFGDIWNVKYLQGFQWDDLVTEREESKRAQQWKRYEALTQERKMNEVFRRRLQMSIDQKKQRAAAGAGASHPPNETKKGLPETRQAPTVHKQKTKKVKRKRSASPRDEAPRRTAD